VLQGLESKIGEVCDWFAGAVNPKNATLVTRGFGSAYFFPGFFIVFLVAHSPIVPRPDGADGSLSAFKFFSSIRGPVGTKRFAYWGGGVLVGGVLHGNDECPLGVGGGVDCPGELPQRSSENSGVAQKAEVSAGHFDGFHRVS
jgi:hypothetical protein